ncbi:K132L protein, partial [Horornis vulcanius]|nr:K132L protein [Horornis vulcanius]
FSCASGEYLEMKNQVCSKCAEGTYSLGSGIKFDEWDAGRFGHTSTTVTSLISQRCAGGTETPCSSWTPRGNYIESNRDDCTVSLIYAVHLKKSGSVFFEYQYIDNNIFFEFFIQNDQCKEMESTADKWVKLTDNGEWGSHSVTLKSGSNILYWRTTGILMGSKVVKPVLVKNITIEGVAYTSECFACKPGTFSDKPGASGCQVCPRDTYSEKGAKECTKCKEEMYYAGGPSLHLVLKLHSTPCELSVSSFQTQIMYKWIEPKICREDLPDALTLPPSGERQDCPPCNPGFYNNASSSCTPCPPGT